MAASERQVIPSLAIEKFLLGRRKRFANDERRIANSTGVLQKLLVERLEGRDTDIQCSCDVDSVLRPDAMIPHKVLRALGYGPCDISNTKI